MTRVCVITQALIREDDKSPAPYVLMPMRV